MNPPLTNLRKFRAILFDFGGTLDSDGFNWKERFYPLYRAAGLQWDFKKYEKYFYYSDDFLTAKKIKTSSYVQTIRMQVSLVLKRAHEYKSSLVDKIVRPFVVDSLKTIQRNRPLIQKLSQKYRLGIVSNFYGNLPVLCKEFRLTQFFDAIVDSNRVGWVKPDPKIFFCALNGLKVSPEQSIFIGDSPSRDMQGAKAIGMPHLWLRAEHVKGVKRCCPKDRDIRSFLELEDLLL